MLEFDLLFPSNLTQQQKLLLKGALFLPTKLDEVQVRCHGGHKSIRRQLLHRNADVQRFNAILGGQA